MKSLTSIVVSVLLIVEGSVASAQMAARGAGRGAGLAAQTFKVAPNTLVGNAADALFGPGTAAGGQLTPGQFGLLRSSFAGGGGGGGYGGGGAVAATAGESFNRGLADVIRAEGDWNQRTAQALVSYNDAWRQAIENDKAVIEAYFGMRQSNRQWRALEHGPRASQEDIARYAKAGVPRRLNPSELDALTGQLAWPILLRADVFVADRGALDHVFAQRALNGTIGTDDFLAVRRVVTDMLTLLKGNIRELPPMQYIAARQFLESVAYEAGTPNAAPGVSPAIAKLR